MPELSTGEQLAAIEQAITRARRVTALAVTAVVVAVVVLALDYAIKNAIVRQVREADRLIKAGSEGIHERSGPEKPKFRGGDIDRNSPPIGRAGMVADTGVGESAHLGGVPGPGAVARRTGGPPVSTDGDGRGAAGGPPGTGPVEISGDGTAQ